MTTPGDGEAGTPDQPEPERPRPESGVPLAALDHALRPVRRVVQYGMREVTRIRYFEANVDRHLALLEALDLPEPLRDTVRELRERTDGFDEETAEARQRRLSTMFAALARIDAVMGLPLPPRRLAPVAKPVQVDEPEPVAPPREPAIPSETDDDDDGEEPPRADPTPTFDESTPLVDADPALAASLAERGLASVADVLNERPTGFDELAVVRADRSSLATGRIAVGVTLIGRATRLSPDGSRVSLDRARLQEDPDDAATLEVVWREAPATTALGARLVLVGIHDGAGRVTEAELVTAMGESVTQARYRFLDADVDRAIRRLVDRWDRERNRRGRDPLPPALLKRLSLVPRHVAWGHVHRAPHEPSRQRLAFDEAIIVALAHQLHRGHQSRGRGIAHSVLHGIISTVGQMMDLQLDDGQQVVFEDVKRELRRPVPMRRVITGEVGVGKGAVSLMATAIVAESRAQVLVLAHDEAGAHERFLHNEPLLREGGLVARLVSSPPTGSQRDAIRRGEIHVVFSTIDLLEHAVEFRRLGLVVAAEREPWGQVGVHQLALPAPRPDLLVTTAVPVGPRILMTAYHDFDVSVLVNDDRKPARISLCAASEREDAYARLRRTVADGGQAIVVFPMLHDRDAIDVLGARRLVRALQGDGLQGLSVGLLHGELAPEERRRVHDDFQHRRLQVLICTSRIEDGPALPAARIVVVEQAEAVDAWRLHRIIGFFSSARQPAEAWLVAGEHASPEATSRLERLQTAPSGVALTETLAELSGVNKVVTDHGVPLPELTWLDLDRDLDWVLRARREARAILDADPGLRRGSHADLAQELVARWPRLWPGGANERWGPPQIKPAPAPEGRRRRRRRRRRR